MKRVNKPNNNSIIFLGDCEMPITKSVTRKNSGSDLSANKIKENNTQKIQITARSNGEMKQQFAASSQQIRWVSIPNIFDVFCPFFETYKINFTKLCLMLLLFSYKKQI